MALTETLNFVKEIFAGSIFGLFAGLIILLILAIIVVYIYTSLAWYTIAKKLKYKNPWLAWIPIANGAMILQLGGFDWRWMLLILITPIVLALVGGAILFIISLVACGIVLGTLIIISRWKIYEKRKYPGWFSLSKIIPKVGMILHQIVIGFVAWKDKHAKKK